MRGRAAGLGAAVTTLALACALLVGVARPARAEGTDVVPAEVRVRSTPGASPSTVVTIRARPDVTIDDRTPGARPGSAGQGAASVGDTFSDEITLWLPGVVVARPAAVDVADDLVTSVRLFPEGTGTTVVVFIRQPVSYNVARPGPLGDVALTLRARTQPQAANAPGGRRPHRVATETGPEEVSVDAESLAYEQATDTLVAKGGVTLRRGPITLRADEVRYARTSGIADATGHVVLIDSHATMEGDAARVDLNDETGWVDDANAELEASGYSLVAGRLEKGIGQQYRVKDGVFTTCRCGGLEPPSWSIASAETDVHLDGVGVAKDAQFRVLDTPVLWMPRMWFPANTDRATGFLFPSMGYSNRRGFQYTQPFFWAIDKSQDLTIATDVETAARIGLVSEYRWIASKATRGTMAVAYFNEAIRSDNPGVLPVDVASAHIPVNRWGVFGNNDAALPWKGSAAYLDVFAVSDDFFLREMNVLNQTITADVSTRTTRFTKSKTGSIKTWQGGLAQLEGSWAQDLVDPPEFTPQRVPQARLEHTEPLIGNNLVGRFNVTGTEFYREQGFDGLREDFGPTLIVPFNAGRWLYGQMDGQLRETAYQMQSTRQFGLFVPDNPEFQRNPRYDPVKNPNQPQYNLVTRGSAFGTLPGDPMNQFHTRELAIVNGRLGTEIAKVYDTGWSGLAKLRHSIEPELRWLYVPGTHANFSSQRARARYDDDGQINYLFRPGANGCPMTGRPDPGGPPCGTFVTRNYLYDEVDAINQRNFFSYGFTTRLLGRGTGPDVDDEEDEDGDLDPETLDEDMVEAEKATEQFTDAMAPDLAPAPRGPSRELLRFSVLQGFDVQRRIVGNSHFSDVDFGFRLTPADFVGASYNATWDFDTTRVLGQSVGVAVREPWWTPNPQNPYQAPSAIGVTYNYVREGVNKVRGVPKSVQQSAFLNAGNEDVSGSVYLRLGDYVGFTFIARYDLDGGPVIDADTGQVTNLPPGFLERDYLLRFISKCNCWAVEAGVADKSNPDERLFRIQVSLLGLGSFGRSAASNYMGLSALNNLGVKRMNGLGSGSGSNGGLW